MKKAKKLKSIELIELERKSFEGRDLEKDLKILKLEISNTELKAEISRLRSLINVSQSQAGLKDIDNKIKIKSEQRKEYVNGLRTKYKIDRQEWGYDYLTGEIKE